MKAVKNDTIDLIVKLDKVEMVRKVMVSDLAEEEKAKLQASFKPQAPVEFLVVALTKLEKGAEDYAVARQLLEKAGESVLAQHYRSKIRAEESDPREAAAQEAWSAIARMATNEERTGKEAEALARSLADFTKTHGDTRFAADHRREIARLVGSSPKPVAHHELLPGMWRGMEGGTRYRFQLKKSGGAFVGSGILWHGMAEKQAVGCASGQRLNAAWEKTYCASYEVAAKLEGKRIELHFLNIRKLVNARD